MKIFWTLLVGLMSLTTFSQDSWSENSYNLLSQRRDSLLFSFFSTKTQLNILLETNGKDSRTYPITAVDSQNLLDIFQEFELLKIDHLIPADNPEFEYIYNDSTKLLVIIGREDFDYYLVIKDMEMAEIVLTRIIEELNYDEIFKKFKQEIKT